MENKMFTVKRYGAWMWIVINNETNLAVKKSDGTLLYSKIKNLPRNGLKEKKNFLIKIENKY